MKKLLSASLIIALTLASACQRDNTDIASAKADDIAGSARKTPVDTGLLPDEIQDYVAQHCAPFDIEDAFHAPGDGYEIWLGDGQELYFDERGTFLLRRRHERPDRGYGPAEGRCMRGDTITPDALPGPVTDYIYSQFNNAVPETVVDKRGRLYAVELSNGVILLFNREGSFIRECDGLDGADRRCMYGREARPAMLPQPAREYIRTNHADTNISAVAHKWNGVWAVALSDGHILLFRPNGDFVGFCE